MSPRKFVLSVVVVASLLSIALAAPQRPRGQAGRPPGGPGQGDAVTILKQALQEAGGAALSSAQEEQLSQLIASVAENQVPFGGDEQLLAARETYQQAVLSGDLAGAKSAAKALAELQLGIMQKRMEDQAAVMIQALAILTEDQVNKLATQFEPGGLFMLLQRLVGPPMGWRGPGAAFGPPSPPSM